MEVPFWNSSLSLLFNSNCRVSSVKLSNSLSKIVTVPEIKTLSGRNYNGKHMVNCKILLGNCVSSLGLKTTVNWNQQQAGYRD